MRKVNPSYSTMGQIPEFFKMQKCKTPCHSFGVPAHLKKMFVESDQRASTDFSENDFFLSHTLTADLILWQAVNICQTEANYIILMSETVTGNRHSESEVSKGADERRSMSKFLLSYKENAVFS